MHTYGQMQTQTEVLNLLRSIWPIDGDEAIPYEGQFGPPQVDESRAIRVARAMLTMGDLRLSDRYAFQNEMKAFGSILVGMGRSKEGLSFFRQLRRWYPHDWYFAYLLAEADRAAGHKLRAVMALFQILRRWDARSIYSGKWIEIQCHLLLAQLYQDLGKSRERDWSYHQRLEHEFVVAAGLADLDMPDLGPGDFETVYASHPETVGEFEKRLELEHKELGYEIPSFLSVDAKRSRAIVHHCYSDYLLGQIHREFDVIKHESIAFQLLPLLGEAPLNSAIACRQAGDSLRALDFANQASRVGPMLLNPAAFEFFISRERWRACEDIGNIDEARKQLARCVELAQKDPLRQHPHVLQSIAGCASDKRHWETSILLATIRRKMFVPHLEYHILAPNLKLAFPDEWKVSEEGAVGSSEKASLVAVFSSQTSWDESTKTPNDASVSLRYSALDEDMSMTAESLGIRHLEGFKRASAEKVEWFLEETQSAAGSAAFCRWKLRIGGPWPKIGMVIAFALPIARFHLLAMCEQHARQLFWPDLESIMNSAVMQLLPSADVQGNSPD